MKQAELLNKAIKLRQQGYSFKEIGERFNISKSTASLWLRDVDVSAKGKLRLTELGVIGREKSLVTNKKKRQKIWQAMADKTIVFKKDLSNYSPSYLKVLLAMLYWGEGYKNGRSLVFMNSDPEMIKSYLFLLRKSFKINESKLKAVIHLHEYHNQSETIKYWANVMKIDKKQISIYKKGNTGVRKKVGYMGCVSLRCYNSLIVDEILLIIKRFHQSI